MTDPRSTDPRSGPVGAAPRGPNQPAPRNNTGWMIAALIALAVLGGVVWNMRDNGRTTAVNPAPRRPGKALRRRAARPRPLAEPVNGSLSSTPVKETE